MRPVRGFEFETPAFSFHIQVSLAIRGGYVPGKITIREYQQNPHFSLVIHGFPLVSDRRIVKTTKTKSANNEGRLYFFS